MTVVSSNFLRKENDLYQTEPWATEALIRNLPVYGVTVWEPAAGDHMMADTLRAHGAIVFTSDIATYTRVHDLTFDFLSDRRDHHAFHSIITNPPYGKGNRDAVRFIERSLERCDGHVALLLTAKFDFGKTRRRFFADNPRFMAKIALLDRIQWFPGQTTGTEDHAWHIWGPSDRNFTTKRMLWEGKEPRQ